MTLPVGFENYFRSVWSADSVDLLLRGLEGEPSVSIRLNAGRLPEGAMPEGAAGRVPWCHEGVYLSERPLFTADPLLHAGAYYVQEASSMFLAHVLRSLTSDSSILTFNSFAALDLCAAPGGKSTILRSLLPPECLLVSNEPLRQRAQVLAENLAKWGAERVVVTQTYARDIARVAKADRSFGGFDLVVTDVPCSGEGMMRKEEEAVRQWSPTFVAECAALQRSIVADIWPALRPGGIMIYSTCTFNPEEDENNVEWIASELGADVISVPADPAWGIRGDLRIGGKDESMGLNGKGALPCYHFIPGLVQGEGFFCAVLRKHGSAENDVLHTETADFIDSTMKSAVSAKRLKGGKSKGGKAVPKSFEERIREGLPTLPTDLLGQPCQTEFPRVELSLADAVRYLQREALVLPPDTPRGIVQVAYRGQRLGLMKNLGTRANNLYPKEWRIRSSFVTPKSIFGVSD